MRNILLILLLIFPAYTGFSQDSTIIKKLLVGEWELDYGEKTNRDYSFNNISYDTITKDIELSTLLIEEDSMTLNNWEGEKMKVKWELINLHSSTTSIRFLFPFYKEKKHKRKLKGYHLAFFHVEKVNNNSLVISISPLLLNHLDSDSIYRFYFKKKIVTESSDYKELHTVKWFIRGRDFPFFEKDTVTLFRNITCSEGCEVTCLKFNVLESTWNTFNILHETIFPEEKPQVLDFVYYSSNSGRWFILPKEELLILYTRRKGFTKKFKYKYSLTNNKLFLQKNSENQERK